MEHYEKYKTVNHQVVNPFFEFLDNEKFKSFEVKISSHSILSKVIGYSMGKLKHKETDGIILVGQDTTRKLILKCAEIIHSKLHGLHQCVSHGSKIHEDIWVPSDVNSDLDTLSVKHVVPVIFILLAKHDLPDQLKFHPNRLSLNTGKRKEPRKTTKSLSQEK